MRFIATMIQWSTVQNTDSSDSLRMIASNRESQFASIAMTSQSGLFDIMGIHEPNDVISHLFNIKRFMTVARSEVPGVHHVDVPLGGDLVFLEELGPGLVGIKHLSDEDHVQVVLRVTHHDTAPQSYLVSMLCLLSLS